MDQSLARSADRRSPHLDTPPPRCDAEASSRIADERRTPTAAHDPDLPARSAGDRQDAGSPTPAEPDGVVARPGAAAGAGGTTIEIVEESYSRRECARCGAPLVHSDRSWGRTWSCSACGHRSF